jgi:hypothetical protein
MMLRYFKWIGECWEILYPYHQRITLVGNQVTFFLVLERRGMMVISTLFESKLTNTCNFI